MKLSIVILGALVASVLGDHDDAPTSFNMPSMDMLSGLTGGQMPQLPPGMNLDDLKDAFDNMPPSMKDRLNDMAGSFGMKLDDVKEALNNPPEQLKQYFENNAQESDGSVPIGKPNLDMGSLLKNIDIGAIGNMMTGMDIGSMMDGLDMGMMGDMLKNVDIGSMMQGMDMGMIGDVMKNMNIGAIGSLMQNVDMGSISGLMQNMDIGMIGNMMNNMDIGAIGNLMQNVDIGSISGMMQNMDLGMIRNMMKGVDIGAIGQMAKNIDLQSISKLVGVKMPGSLSDVKRMMGVSDDASWNNAKNQIKERLMTMGVPIDDPKAMFEFASDKLKALNIPLPEGVDLSDLMGSLRRHMEVMGIPSEPEKLKDFVMGHFGFTGTKLEDLKNPSAIADILKRKVFGMLGLNEDEDATTIKERMEDQLFEELQKQGANVNKDSTHEEIQEEMNRIVTKEIDNMKHGLQERVSNELTNMGLEVESLSPQGVHSAIKNKLSAMGLPVDDPHALKSHVMKMLKKELLSKVTPMIINMFMPRQPAPPMPPMAAGPPQTIPLNLDIEVNVQQPPQPTRQYVPRYLQGAEIALDHPIEYMDDREVFYHIMTVREALRSGEMGEDVIQEMLEDLMEARLKIRVLSVKNMFLRDRIADQGVSRRGPAPFLPRQPIRQTPTLLRTLRGDRVL